MVTGSRAMQDSPSTDSNPRSSVPAPQLPHPHSDQARLVELEFELHQDARQRLNRAIQLILNAAARSAEDRSDE